jgi:hypothetical protein
MSSPNYWFHRKARYSKTDSSRQGEVIKMLIVLTPGSSAQAASFRFTVSRDLYFAAAPRLVFAPNGPFVLRSLAIAGALHQHRLAATYFAHAQGDRAVADDKRKGFRRDGLRVRPVRYEIGQSTARDSVA